MYTIHGKDPILFHKASSKICDVAIHLHDVYEIFQAQSDNIRYYIEGHAYDLNQGDIIITNMKEVHRPITLDNGYYNRRFIQFRPELFHSFFDELNPLSIFEHRKKGTMNCFRIKNNSILNDLLNAIEHCSDAPLELIKRKTYMIQLFIELYRDFNSRSKSDTLHIDSKALEIKKYIDEHFTDKLTLESLSQIHYLDKYYMCHLFKTNIGFTIVEYMQSKRIQLAKQLIQEGQPIQSVATDCGFSEYSNFYRTFKKLVQESPKSYQKKMKQNNRE